MFKKEVSVAVIEPIGGHGGMDYYDYGLCLGLGNHNVKCVYYTCDKTGVRDFQNVSTVITFRQLWNATFLLKVLRYLLGFLKSFNDARRRNIKIVHLHFFEFRVIDLLVLILAKTYGFKTVATIHDINSFDKPSNRLVEKICFKLISEIIVHNKTSSESLNRIGEFNQKLSIIPHGNYTPFVEKVKYKADLDESGTLKLLFFGQIKRVKGLEILLDSIAILKRESFNIELVIAGKPWKSDLDYYNSLIDSLGIKDIVTTHFRYIPDDEVSSFFEMCDLIVLPYKEIYQSGVLLLTMSYGVPLVCSDLPAFKEYIIDKKNGFLFESESSESLSNTLKYISKNRDILREVQTRANETISELDWVKIGEKTKLIYEKLIN